MSQEIKEFKRPRLPLTRNLRVPNYYTLALDGEFRDFAFNEERAPSFKGQWRDTVFKVSKDTPIDLEVGTGNGKHFQHLAIKTPERMLVGLEIKYKPLIQTIRGAVRQNATNSRVCRFHAFNVDQLFSEQEINDVYIHFPDPWVSPRKPRNRFVSERNLDILWTLQRPGSFLEFKTDSREYFLWSLDQIQNSKYEIEFQTLDLHGSQSQARDQNFITQFESIFIRQKIPINYIRLLRK